MGREVANVLLHLLGAGRAVQAKNIDRKGLKDRHDSGDIRAHQHRAGGLHGHADHQRTPFACLGKGLFDPLEGRLDLQDVLTGFNDEQVDISCDQALGLLRKGVAHLIEANVPKGWQLRRRPHGAGHKPGLLRR